MSSRMCSVVMFALGGMAPSGCDREGSVDVDASVDAAELPAWCEEPAELGYLFARCIHTDPGGPVAMTVLTVADWAIELEGATGPNGTARYEATLPAAGPRLPAEIDVGQEVEVTCGGCGADQPYTRLRSIDGRLLLEGGDPSCADIHREHWPDALLVTVPRPGAEWCNLPPPSPDCCCDTRLEVDVAFDVARDRALEVGEPVEVEIEGETLIGMNLGAWNNDDGPCSFDGSGTRANAYVVPAP